MSQERRIVKTDWPRKLLPAAAASLTAVRENVPVMLLTGVAFGASYGHIAKLCGDFGPHGWVQFATAGCVDLLCIIGAEERQRDKRIGRPRRGFVTWPTVVLFVGIAVTLAANAATAERDFFGYCVAAWPAGALLLAVSILERRASYEVPRQQAESALRAELDAERAAREVAEGDCAALREDHEAAQQERAELLARLGAAQQQAEERHQGGTEGGTVPPKPVRHKSASAAPRSAKAPEAQAAEVLTRAEAEIILDAEPGISGSELGRRLGVQEGYGRKLKRELAKSTPGGGQ